MEMKRNYGVAFFRVILAYSVIGGHFSNGGLFFSTISIVAVPCFMLLSFIFMGRHIENFMFESLVKRLARLFVPYLFWPLMYMYIYSFLYCISGIDFLNMDLRSAIFLQLAFGHSIVPVFWFHWTLILLTFLAFALFKIKPMRLFVAFNIVLMIFAFFCQYSGINSYLFGRFNHEIRWPLGRFLEMLPYFSAGLLISPLVIEKFNFFENKRCLRLVISSAAFMLFILLQLVRDIGLRSNFLYAGLVEFGRSVVLTVAFWYLPLEVLLERFIKLKVCFDFLTRYTMGVYCLHLIVGKLFTHFFNVENDFLLCLFIYAISFFVCWLLEKNLKNKNVYLIVG